MSGAVPALDPTLALPLPLHLAAVEDGLLPLVYLLSFLGVSVFVLSGWLLFSAGWESYEEKYLEGAERSVEDLFLTIPPQQLLWLSILGAFTGFALGFFLSDGLILGAVFAVPGFFSPRGALALKRRARAAKFVEQLTEAMVTVTNALRSGFSLPKAFQLVSSDMPKPICQEFGILVQELRLGMEIDEGFESMLERMPCTDLELVATSISISNSIGGNLADVFDAIAETIRERRRIEGRIDSLTAQGKAQGTIVALLPIVVGGAIYWIDPELMEPMFTRPWPGWVILGVIVVFECLGFFFIRKITSIEV